MHFFFKKMSQPPADFDEGVVPMETEPFTPLKPQQECKAILSYKQIAGRRDFGCQVPQSKQSARVKYKKFRVSNRNVAGHVISYFGHHPDQEIQAGYEVSHLCHNPRCVNNNHLVYELKGDNRDRNSCNKYAMCPHQPTCLARIQTSE